MQERPSPGIAATLSKRKLFWFAALALSTEYHTNKQLREGEKMTAYGFGIPHANAMPY